MSVRVIHVVALVALVVSVSPLGAQEIRRRSPVGGDGGPVPPGTPVRIPRAPYEGSWEGTLTMRNSAGDVVSTESVTIRLNATNVEQHLYEGQTLASTPALARHDATGDGAVHMKTHSTTEPVRRRTPDGGSSAPDGPRRTLAAPLTPTASNELLLVHHTPTRSLILCGEDGRCEDLPVARWEEQGADGRVRVYSARLVSAHRIDGTVTISGTGSDALLQGTLTLARMR